MLCLVNQSTAYLATLLRLLNEAKSAGLVGPGGAVGLVEEEEEEESPRDFQEAAGPPDYDETNGMGGGPQTAWRMQPRMDR